MLRPLLLLGALALIGCGRATPTAADPPVPATPVPKSGGSPEVQEFREQVAVYLAEARAGAKLLGLNLTPEKAKAKAAQMTDLYTHLPDVPKDVDATGEVAGRLKNIHGAFAAAEEMARIRANLGRVAGVEGLKKADDSLAKVAADVRQWAAEVETRVGLK